MKKKDYAINNFKKTISIIKCPICNSNINIDCNSLVCVKNHTFDLSKKGVVILNKNIHLKKDKIYNKNLFLNRREIINNNFYCEIHKYISNFIKNKSLKIIVDMGCGEGSHDNAILKKCPDVFIIGIDLSKDAIDLSSDYLFDNFLGIVSDINKMPLKDKTIDLVINILSPSNEEEINRVLKKEGYIIKVTPKKEYLCELRRCLHIDDYENEELIEKNIKRKYIIEEKIVINKTYNLKENFGKYICGMTPLTNNINIEKVKLQKITISLNIYLLRIKKK